MICEYLNWGVSICKIPNSGLINGTIGIYHFNPYYIIGAFLLGVVITYLAVRRA